jgi:endo-1,4-beta-xylanase
MNFPPLVSQNSSQNSFRLNQPMNSNNTSQSVDQPKNQFSYGKDQSSAASPEKDQNEGVKKLLESILELLKKVLGMGGNDKGSSPDAGNKDKSGGQNNANSPQSSCGGSGDDAKQNSPLGNSNSGAAPQNQVGSQGNMNEPPNRENKNSNLGNQGNQGSSGAAGNDPRQNFGYGDKGAEGGNQNNAGSSTGANPTQNNAGSNTGANAAQNNNGSSNGENATQNNTGSNSGANSSKNSERFLTAAETSEKSPASTKGGKSFGYGVDADKFIGDKGYRDKVFGDIKASGNKGILTAENLMKPDSMNDPANRAKAAQFAKLANEGGAEVRGHTLNWHRQSDPGMAALQSGDSKAGIARLENTIGNTMKDVKGVKTWDVMNEAFNEDGSLRGANSDNGNKNDSLRVIPGDKNGKDDGMEMSYKIARKNAPDAKLMYNDFNLEFNDKKFGAALSKIKDMNARSQAEGGPKLVDGIGFQGHFKAENFSDPKYMDTMRKHIQEAKKAGLDVHFTEIDIRDDKDITKEAGALGKLLKEEGVSTAEWWNVSDKESWIPKEFGAGNHSPTLNNDDGSRKPAFKAFMDAFK